MTTFLLAFTALFSIVNPLSGAFIFFGATAELDPYVRASVARWVAIYSLAIVAASLYVGAYVLEFLRRHHSRCCGSPAASSSRRRAGAC